MKAFWLLVLWLGSTATAFWVFDGKYRLPVTSDRSLKIVESLPAKRSGILEATESCRAVLVNFWNPGCACSKFNEPHVRSIADRFLVKGVAIITIIVNPHGTDEEILRLARERSLPGKLVIDRDGALVEQFDILAAPAAVVFDSAGAAVYRGAYNISRTCTDHETAYAEKALASVIEGRVPELPSLPFYGCALARREL